VSDIENVAGPHSLPSEDKGVSIGRQRRSAHNASLTLYLDEARAAATAATAHCTR
jgi:hypothetical protein